MKTSLFTSLCIASLILLPSCFHTKKESQPVTTDVKTAQTEKTDADLLINKLVIAFADEWMASYQYWVAAKLVKGTSNPKVTTELIEHYQDETRHADMIAKRLIELNGDFRMFPQDWHKIGGCHFDSITDTDVKTVLHENIKGEECAIDFYKDLLKIVEGKDKKTYDMVLEILNDEIKHKEDLEKLQ